MQSHHRVRGYALVLIAASLWATIGLFYRVLDGQYGITPGVIVAYRVGIPAFVLLVTLGLIQPRLLYVARRDWLYFAAFGAIGVAAFYAWYIEATLRGPIAVASVLLYMAPVWITVWAITRQGEPITSRTLLALGLAVIGCALVANIFNRANLAINGTALLFGVLSGLGYAAYSLFSAEGTRRGYGAWTVVLYSLGLGAIILFALQPLDQSIKPLLMRGAWPWLLGVALGPTLLAPICFTLGLRSVPTSNASILATIEPVITALLGWTVLVPPEPLNKWQLIGGAAVIAAVIVLVTGEQQTQVSTQQSGVGSQTIEY